LPFFRSFTEEFLYG